MNAKKFSVALGNARDEYVSEAIEYQRRRKRHNWGEWGAMAACLCLIVMGSLLYYSLKPDSLLPANEHKGEQIRKICRCRVS